MAGTEYVARYVARDRQVITLGLHTLQLWYCTECGAVTEVEVVGALPSSQPLGYGEILIGPRELHQKWHESLKAAPQRKVISGESE